MLQETSSDKVTHKAGLAFWMGRVVDECNRVVINLAPDAIHDLRVALRRCRSIAESLRSFDPHPGWREMRTEGARLFDRLGELRDIQVMIEWMKTPGAPQDDGARILVEDITRREIELKEAAAAALGRFDKKKWAGWTSRLSKRAARIPLDGGAFHHLALERWHEAYLLHRQALRNRSHVGFHRLRVGLKRFRYTVENFLPDLHEVWGSNLRDLQDMLGEMHDLYVLLQTAIEIGAIQTKESRAPWRAWIDGECNRRLERYREKMTGKDSLWHIWRAGLPQGGTLKSTAAERLETWASFRDPDREHTARATQLALQLHDGLASHNLFGNAVMERTRPILHVAALLHAVGAAGHGKKPHKRSYQMVSQLQSPIGWTQEDFKIAALVVRYHRGALPASTRKDLQDLTKEQLELTRILAGILRLAVAFMDSKQREMPNLELRMTNQAVLIGVSGYDKYAPPAQKLAWARHLLEVACDFPVIIRSL